MDDLDEKFGKWLYKKYTEWLAEQLEVKQTTDNPYKRNIGGYCQYLNISRAIFSQYVHYRRKPTRRVIHSLAAVYGNKVYIELGLATPSPDIEDILKYWDDLDANDKTKIMAIIHTSKHFIDNKISSRETD